VLETVSGILKCHYELLLQEDAKGSTYLEKRRYLKMSAAMSEISLSLWPQVILPVMLILSLLMN